MKPLAQVAILYLLACAVGFAIGISLAAHAAEAQTLTGTSMLSYSTSVPDCDSLRKTPAETLDCKLAYWKGEVGRLNKELADLNSRIVAAQERVDAFTEAERAR